MKSSFLLALILAFLLVSIAFSQTTRDSAKDRAAITALEEEWLHARDAATLDRILASDFVHVIPFDHFLTKQEHIDWFVKHPQPKGRHTEFEKMDVRLYGNVAIVNGSFLATYDDSKQLDRTMFTDVFVFRDGRWQAVNAQENRVER
jgi:ketosteroid isomerase-like protein